MPVKYYFLFYLFEDIVVEILTLIAIFICVTASIILLIILAITDLKKWLLPNIYVFPFAILGIIFHIVTNFYFLEAMQIFLGMIVGGGFLLIIRIIANSAYKQEALGLGDVKLMGAAGLWLGMEGVLFAITIGALCGLLHGLALFIYKKYKTGKIIDFRKMSLPAGPGFICGIVITALLRSEELLLYVIRIL